MQDAIGYMPQRFGLYEDLTVRRTSTSTPTCAASSARARATLRRLLAFTDLAPLHRPAGRQASGGMKQKLGLACALVRSPRLLLLDEPSVGVDPISRRELWRMVYDLVERGRRRRVEHGLPRRGRALRRGARAERGHAALRRRARAT